MCIGSGRYESGSVTPNLVNVIQTQEVRFQDRSKSPLIGIDVDHDIIQASLRDGGPTFIQAYVKPAFEQEYLTSVRTREISCVFYNLTVCGK
jgi:hypothetical protein